MRVAILSRGPQLYSTRRLREAVVARGHSAEILDTLAISIAVDRDRPAMWFRGKTLGAFTAIIPRIGSSVTAHGCAVVRQFEGLGTTSLVGSRGIFNGRDKLIAYQMLSAAGIAIPRTIVVRDRAELAGAIRQVGGAPVIIKLPEGTHGAGVILADSDILAESIMEALQVSGAQALVQQFIEESRGRDLRALVVGRAVVASMRRYAREGEFRSNVHRGGRGVSARLEPDVERVAVAAAQAIGLEVAGVDLLETADGPVVLEVNPSPGLEGIETTTGVDVASKIVTHLEDLTAARAGGTSDGAFG